MDSILRFAETGEAPGALVTFAYGWLLQKEAHEPAESALSCSWLVLCRGEHARVIEQLHRVDCAGQTDVQQAVTLVIELAEARAEGQRVDQGWY